MATHPATSNTFKIREKIFLLSNPAGHPGGRPTIRSFIIKPSEARPIKPRANMTLPAFMSSEDGVFIFVKYKYKVKESINFISCQQGKTLGGLKYIFGLRLSSITSIV